MNLVPRDKAPGDKGEAGLDWLGRRLRFDWNKPATLGTSKDPRFFGRAEIRPSNPGTIDSEASQQRLICTPHSSD